MRRTSQFARDVETLRHFQPPVDWRPGFAAVPRRGVESFMCARPNPALRLGGLNFVAESLEAGNFQLDDAIWLSAGINAIDIHPKSLTRVNPTPGSNRLFFRRMAASGGAQYPAGLGICLKETLGCLPAGVYTYSPRWHALIPKRAAVGTSFGEGPIQFFVYCDIWKNFDRYHDFGYRLHTLDAGVLLGSMQVVLERTVGSFQTTFQFDEKALSAECVLGGRGLAIYCLVDVNAKPAWRGHNGRISEALSGSLSQRSSLPSRRVLRMHQASTKVQSSTAVVEPINISTDRVIAIRAAQRSVDIRDALCCRRSTGRLFSPIPVSSAKLAAILQFSMSGFRQDCLLGQRGAFPYVFVSVVRSNRLEPGVYSVQFSNGVVRFLRVRLGSIVEELEDALLVSTVNLYNTSMVLHIFGRRDFFEPELGPRGYRIQQMFAGVLAARLQIAASALNLGSHILLGFDDDCIERICRTDRALMSLVQVVIGHTRKDDWLGGAVLW
ncbi:hypothetical protein ACC794_02980 [Rhizobium ruizarguesonis]